MLRMQIMQNIIAAVKNVALNKAILTNTIGLFGLHQNVITQKVLRKLFVEQKHVRMIEIL